jgi:hypothetical protein
VQDFEKEIRKRKDLSEREKFLLAEIARIRRVYLRQVLELGKEIAPLRFKYVRLQLRHSALSATLKRKKHSAKSKSLLKSTQFVKRSGRGDW